MLTFSPGTWLKLFSLISLKLRWSSCIHIFLCSSNNYVIFHIFKLCSSPFRSSLNCFQVLISQLLITVFVDTRLWKTKHPRKLFQTSRQSCMLLRDRIEIHQSQPDSMTQGRLEGHTSGCNWWISIRSARLTEILETFSRMFCFPKSCINENGGKSKCTEISSKRWPRPKFN